MIRFYIVFSKRAITFGLVVNLVEAMVRNNGHPCYDAIKDKPLN